MTIHRGMSSRTRLFSFVLALVVGTSVLAAPKPTSRVSRWMDVEAEAALKYLLGNISPRGTARGVVVASPSRTNPDYFYHWTRDAALVMDVVVDFYRFSRSVPEKKFYLTTLSDYIQFTRQNQITQTLTGLGEPKFNVDGSAFNAPWGRPQNDGPALRASTLTKFAFQLMQEGLESEVRRTLYDGSASSVIKADLEFVAHNWQPTCYDLWEEISGHHFYTRFIQRKALVYGAKLAYALGDKGAADFYLLQAKSLERDLARHWDAGANYLLTIVDKNGGIDYKSSNLDSSVVLAALHGYLGDGFFGPSDDRMLATFQKAEETFKRLYPINHNTNFPATAIGRYPEDKYNGNGNSEGNPWFLLTSGFGEFMHKSAAEFQRKGRIDITSVNQAFFKSLGVNGKSGQVFSSKDPVFGEILTRMKDRGDEYISRAGFHGTKDGRFSEQINRHTGYMQGAPDLTWSYAAFISAYWAHSAR